VLVAVTVWVIVLTGDDVEAGKSVFGEIVTGRVGGTNVSINVGVEG
jgi:hypothetical protein